MVKLVYIEPSGAEVTVDVAEGWTVMQAAVSNGVDGIVGECGGSCACATCHVYVEGMVVGELPSPQPGELEMLGNVAAERRPNSRLGCQLIVAPELEGLVLRAPDHQE